MEYGALIRQSWRLTWRHRFLWVLGLFTGSTLGSCSAPVGDGGSSQWRMDQRELEGAAPSIARAVDDVGLWVTQNLGLALLAVAVLVLIGLALLVVSLIAQGGMATATSELARGRDITAGRAWSAGLRLFWRYLLLWLTFIGLTIALFLAIAAILAVVFMVGSVASGASQVVLYALGVLLALALIVAAVVVLIGLSIAAAFAQRAIAVEDLGPIAALESGIRLLRSHLGTSLLVWLIGIGLGIASGIAVVIGIVVAVIPLGLIGALLFATAGGVSTALVAYGVLALLVLIAVAWLLSAIVNTFFWNYWTIAYLTLSGRMIGPVDGQASA